MILENIPDDAILYRQYYKNKINKPLPVHFKHRLSINEKYLSFNWSKYFDIKKDFKNSDNFGIISLSVKNLRTNNIPKWVIINHKPTKKYLIFKGNISHTEVKSINDIKDQIQNMDFAQKIVLFGKPKIEV